MECKTQNGMVQSSHHLFEIDKSNGINKRYTQCECCCCVCFWNLNKSED